MSVRAAVEVAERVGLLDIDPLVFHETNNTVVWLRPHDVVAKVGTHPDSGSVLRHEHRVARALAVLDAPIARPLPDVHMHEPTGATVTMWQRLETVEGTHTGVGSSLLELHGALDRVDVDMPPLRDDFLRARRTLVDDRSMAALDAGELSFLRGAFETLLEAFDDLTFEPRALHGETHEGNRVATPQGLRWIDFEGACLGPREWDLVFLPDDELAPFGTIDTEVLDLLRGLDAARRGTWAWAMARFPQMRALGQTLLAALHEHVARRPR